MNMIIFNQLPSKQERNEIPGNLNKYRDKQSLDRIKIGTNINHYRIYVDKVD